MEFHEWTSLYDSTRKREVGRNFPAPADYYRRVRTGPVFREFPAWEKFRFDTEARWYGQGRPYYLVYPSIVEPLLRLRLDIDGGAVPTLPLGELVVRFAKGHELPTGSGRRVRTILLTETTPEPGARRLALFANAAEPAPLHGNPLADTTFCLVPLRCGTTLETVIHDTVKTMPQLSQQDLIEVATFMKLACTLCMLGDDPEIIEPDVLAKDREKWERTGDPAIVERAVRRGKRGWLVGAKLEVIPHVRRPHMALRWTGPGGATPKIVPVKGSIVHREKVERLPTGRLDAETKPNQE